MIFRTKLGGLLACLIPLFFAACDSGQPESEPIAESLSSRSETELVIHDTRILPNSVANIRSYQRSRGPAYTDSGVWPQGLPEGSWYISFAFAPSALSPAWYGQFVNDEDFRIFDYDIANPHTPALSWTANDTSGMAQLKDGLYHCTVPLAKYRYYTEGLPHRVRDTLYYTEDSDYVYALLEHSGLIDRGLGARGLFERPEGYVRYADTDFGECRPVRKIKVWAIWHGIPVYRYTDMTGKFRIPAPFLVGTFISTEAQNPEVHIRHIDFTTFVGGANTIATWVLGPQAVYGWVRKKNLDEINICFDEHSPRRWWAMILNAVSLTHAYAAQDQIPGPPSLQVWSLWSNENNTCSAPMLAHGAVLDGPLQEVMRLGGIDPASFPLALDPFGHGFLPDLILQSADSGLLPGSVHYSSRRFHTLFHELGHVLHWRKAGNFWWSRQIGGVILQSMDQRIGCSETYPALNEAGGGLSQLAECWAEYVGDRYVTRYYPPQVAFKRWFSKEGALENYVTNIDEELFDSCPDHPYGIFFDLVDEPSLVEGEDFDKIGGFIFSQLYDFLSPDDESLCDYIHHDIEPVAFQEGKLNQLKTMVDRDWGTIPIVDGHQLSCWP